MNNNFKDILYTAGKGDCFFLVKKDKETFFLPVKKKVPENRIITPIRVDRVNISRPE